MTGPGFCASFLGDVMISGTSSANLTFRGLRVSVRAGSPGEGSSGGVGSCFGAFALVGLWRGGGVSGVFGGVGSWRVGQSWLAVLGRVARVPSPIPIAVIGEASGLSLTEDGGVMISGIGKRGVLSKGAVCGVSVLVGVGAAWLMVASCSAEWSCLVFLSLLVLGTSAGIFLIQVSTLEYRDMLWSHSASTGATSQARPLLPLPSFAHPIEGPPRRATIGGGRVSLLQHSVEAFFGTWRLMSFPSRTLPRWISVLHMLVYQESVLIGLSVDVRLGTRVSTL